MSLGKATTRIKEGIGQLQSVSGLKRIVLHMAIGFTLGIIAQLVLEAIWFWSHLAEWTTKAGYPALIGFTIFPNNTQYRSWNPTTQTYETKQGLWMAWDSVILLIITVALLFTKKFWLVIGFFLGWYISAYMDLYTSLGIPTPTYA